MDLLPQEYCVYAFDGFRLDPVSRVLTRAVARVVLSPRLFDTLLFLVEHQAGVVERDALLRAVWPGRVVDDGSVARAVSSLRAALKEAGGDEGLIVTAPGRGYRFGALVQRLGRAEDAPNLSTPAAVAKTPARQAGAWGLAIVLAGVVLVSALWAGVRTPPAPPPYTPDPHSVAVLPFANLSAEAADAYLADGLSDELIDVLGRVGALRVAARASSAQFRDSSDAPADIGRKLGVAELLRGSVRHSHSQLAVHAELIDVAGGKPVWSRDFARGAGDMLAVQGEIAQAAVAHLNGVVLPADSSRIALGGTANEAAYYAMLQGVVATEMETAQARQTALPYFDRAVAADPKFAMAYAGRSIAELRVAKDTWTDAKKCHDLIEAALHDAQAALALAPDLALAHSALGQALCYGRLYCGRGLEEERRAIELAPGDARIVNRAAWMQLFSPDTAGALQRVRRAAALDPLSPVIFRNVALVAALTGHASEAQAALDRAGALAPSDKYSDVAGRGDIALWLGQYDAAARLCDKRSDPDGLLCFAVAAHATGHQPQAEAALQALHTLLGEGGAYQYAEIAAAWGQPGAALDWLRAALRLRDPGMALIVNDPLLASLRGNPAYLELARSIGTLDDRQ